MQAATPRGGPLTTAALQAALQQGGVGPKIADFGMAALMQRGCVAQRHTGRGTPFFVAPEVLRAGHIHRGSDVYSFGVIMWELMAGTAVYVPRCGAPRPPALSTCMRTRCDDGDTGGRVPCRMRPARVQLERCSKPLNFTSKPSKPAVFSTHACVQGGRCSVCCPSPHAGGPVFMRAAC